MKIMALGDVVGRVGVEHLEKHLWKIREQYRPDLVIVNGENANDIHGITAGDARDIFSFGADVITLGNHAFWSRDIGAFLDENNNIIRPANYPAACPGNGYNIADACGRRVLVINVSGVAFLDPLDSPFDTVEKILEREKGNYDISVMDIHAEATSEKYALARYFDGKINIMFGTHTHVATADEQVLAGGSGYITDLGMTGPTGGVLGTDTEAVIYKMKTHMPVRFKVASGKCESTGALFEVSDEKPYRVLSVKRIKF